MQMVDIAARLERKFGLGQDAGARRRLYARLEREVQMYGEDAYRAIATAAADAETARDPGRYFAVAATRRLRQRGLLDAGGGL